MTSILNLTFRTPDICTLNILVIDDELTTPSDYKVIVGDLADPEREAGSMGTIQEVTELDVRAMSEDSRKEAARKMEPRYTR